MDDLPVFENPLTTKCALTTNYTRYETFGFVNSFTSLIATSDADINDFVKSMHATNSDRPANGKILIPASEVKDLIF